MGGRTNNRSAFDILSMGAHKGWGVGGVGGRHFDVDPGKMIVT